MMISDRQKLVAFLCVWLIDVCIVQCAEPNVSEETETDYIRLEDLVRKEILTYFKLILSDNENELNSLLLVKGPNGANYPSSQQNLNVIPQDAGVRLRGILISPPNGGVSSTRSMSIPQQSYQSGRNGRAGTVYQNGGYQIVPGGSDYYVDDQVPSYEYQIPGNRVQYVNGNGPRMSIARQPGMAPTRYQYNGEPLAVLQNGGIASGNPGRRNAKNRSIRLPPSAPGSESFSVNNEGSTLGAPIMMSSSGGGLGGMNAKRMGQNVPSSSLNEGQPMKISMGDVKPNLDQNIGLSSSSGPSDSSNLVNSGSKQGIPLGGLFSNDVKQSQGGRQSSSPLEPLNVVGKGSNQVLSSGAMLSNDLEIPVTSSQSTRKSLSSPLESVSVGKGSQGLPLGVLFSNDAESTDSVNTRDLDQDQALPKMSSSSPQTSVNLPIVQSSENSPLNSLGTGSEGSNLSQPMMMNSEDLSGDANSLPSLNVGTGGSVGGPSQMTEDFSSDMNPMQTISLGEGGSMGGQEFSGDASPLQVITAGKEGSMRGPTMMSGDMNPLQSLKLGRGSSMRGPTMTSEGFSGDMSLPNRIGKNGRPNVITASQNNKPTWKDLNMPSSGGMMEAPFGGRTMQFAGVPMGGNMRSQVQPGAMSFDSSSENGMENSMIPNTGNMRYRNQQSGYGNLRGMALPRNYYILQHPTDSNGFSNNYMNEAGNYMNEAGNYDETPIREVIPNMRQSSTSEGSSSTAGAGGNRRQGGPRKFKVLVMNSNDELPANLKIAGLKPSSVNSMNSAEV